MRVPLVFYTHPFCVVKHSAITHTHTLPCHTHRESSSPTISHTTPRYTYTHTRVSHTDLPFSHPLGVTCTRSCSLSHGPPSFPLLVTHPPEFHPASPPSYTHLPLLHTPPLMSPLHTSMCHTQPQPLWSHTHTLFLSYTLTSFSWSHPTRDTPVSHTLNCRLSSTRPLRVHTQSRPIRQPTHTPLHVTETLSLMCHTLPQSPLG